MATTIRCDTLLLGPEKQSTSVVLSGDALGVLTIAAPGGLSAIALTTSLAPAEADMLFMTLNSNSTFLTGTNISYSGGRGSAVERLLGNWTAVTGGFHALYARVESTGVFNDTSGGSIAVKGVTSSTTAKTAAAGMYGGQFIARHSAATGIKAANAAPFIGVEGAVTQGDAGQIGTAIGISAAYHIPAGNDVYDAGAVWRALQVTCDDQNDGGAPSEETGICIWNMTGNQDNAIKVVHTASGFDYLLNVPDDSVMSKSTQTNAGTQSGWLKVLVGAAARYIKLWDTAPA